MRHDIHVFQLECPWKPSDTFSQEKLFCISHSHVLSLGETPLQIKVQPQNQTTDTEMHQFAQILHNQVS